MGYSKTYSLFSAICEITAGILLLIRRTTVLGGLLSFAIMLNIVILNFSYDVPVKLFSIHLTLISIFVIHQNLFNLLSFFTGHTAKIDFNRIELKNKWLKTGRILFIVLILSSVIAPFYYQISSQKTPPDSDNNLNGIYSMESFNVNGDSVNTDENGVN